MTLTESLNWFLNLINIDDAICPYCKSHCNISSQSVDNSEIHYDTYNCVSCNELYCLSFDADICFDFHVSCKELLITLSMHPDGYCISRGSEIRLGGKNIPLFYMDFSDKETLYNKLKTYILFS